MDVPAPQTLTTPTTLAAAGLIPTSDVPALDAVAEKYAVAIPPAMQALMDLPAIARQFLPTVHELTTAPEERTDPIGDHAHSPVKGIVHRYPDRVLLMPTLACAVYCRFCFRREDVGERGLTARELAAALAYIRGHADIWEVILTGGDPLVLSARRLSEIIAAINEMAHVKVIRVHTRVPVAAPERIDCELVEVLRASRKPVYVAIHCNTAAELTVAMRAACARLADAGIPLLAQTVLLKGVNDSVEALEALMRGLVEARIRPYYLHQLDLAPGTSQFRVPLAQGQEIVRSLRGRLSGIALPTYILDIPGGAGKVPVGPAYISISEHGYTVEDDSAVRHAYKGA